MVVGGDTYELLEELGRGGMGVVYKARQNGLDRIVALKMMLPHVCADQTSLQRFRREAKAAALLNSPNVVRVFSFGTTEQSRPVLVMEYVEGSTLDKIMNGQPLASADFYRYFKDVLTGLSAAHKSGITHRDLKPANILVTTSGIAKISDFGIACASELDLAGSQSATRTGTVIGSPSYMSPEQCRGERADTRSDVYAVGCMMYEAVTGQPPFCGDTLLEVMFAHLHNTPDTLSDVTSAALADLVARALVKQPEKRFANAEEMLAALELCARTPQKRRHKFRFRTRLRPSLVAAATAAITVCALACLWFWHKQLTGATSPELPLFSNRPRVALDRAYTAINDCLLAKQERDLVRADQLYRESCRALDQAEHDATATHCLIDVGRAHIYRGILYSEFKAPTDAIDEAQQGFDVLQQVPGDHATMFAVTALQNISFYNKALNRRDQAVSSLDQAIAFAGKRENLQCLQASEVLKGKLLSQYNQSEAAERVFNSVVQRGGWTNPDAVAEAHLGLACIDFTRNDLDGYIDHSLNAAKLLDSRTIKPDEPGIYEAWLRMRVMAYTFIADGYGTKGNKDLFEYWMKQALDTAAQFNVTDNTLVDQTRFEEATFVAKVYGDHARAMKLLCEVMEHRASVRYLDLDSLVLNAAAAERKAAEKAAIAADLKKRFDTDYSKLQAMQDLAMGSK